MVNDQFVSLYRRFRPGRFADLKGQPHVVQGLKAALRDGPAHAYLFSGPRGTGKTSAARILARALNCATPVDGEPCGECPSCISITAGSSFDVQELDAASNNGVDAMRDLVAHAALATPGRWKVYIVDEVHMLSQAAANALLKTLEEPPPHVVFVLATTDPQKTPITIRSRTQQYEFRLLGSDTLLDLLRDVRDRAELPLDDEALGLAVRRGRGSARDALSALDQVVASGSSEEVRPQLTELVESLCDEDAKRALLAASTLYQAGWAPQQLAVEVVDDLRQAFLLALAPDLAQASGEDRVRLEDQARRLGLARLVRSIEVLGRAQVDMREAPDARAVLEVALVRMARVDLDTSPAAILERLSRLEQLGVVPSRVSSSQASNSGTIPTSSGMTEDHGSGSQVPLASRPALGALRRRPRPSSKSDSEAPDSEISHPGDRAEPSKPAVVSEGAASSEPPERDALVEAWGDEILRTLPARAKAFYGGGRFVSMENGVACFALPTVHQRDRCAEAQPLVEEALSKHFGCRVPLRLVVEQAEPTRPLETRTSKPGEMDEFDPDDPGVPLEAVDLAEARLLEAFPGAEEVPK